MAKQNDEMKGVYSLYENAFKNVLAAYEVCEILKKHKSATTK